MESPQNSLKTLKNIAFSGIALIATLLLSGCEDERVVRQELMEDCTNHYRAESYKVAAKTCLKAAEYGIAHSQWILANIYYYNRDDAGREKSESLKWFIRAADSGITEAQTFVGEMYLFADGVEEDFKKAYQYFKMAAEKSDPDAEFNIAIMFYEGKGKKQDLSAAISWFKKSAAREHQMSINNLAWLHATSANKSYRNADKAVFWADKLPEDSNGSSTFFDTKAAAYALAGDFKEAVNLQNRAIDNLPEDIEEDLLLEFQERLEAYQGEQAWTEVK